MNNSNVLPHKSSDLNRSPPNSNYPHAYLNGLGPQPNNQMFYQNYNNFQPNYANNFNQYQHYQQQPMIPPNFNYYSNASYNGQSFPPASYGHNNYTNYQHNNSHANYQQPQNRHFNNNNGTYNRHTNQGNQQLYNNNRNFNNKKNKQKSPHSNEPKQNAKESSDNDKFYCESCDRGFKVEDKYKEHCMTHRTVRIFY